MNTHLHEVYLLQGSTNDGCALEELVKNVIDEKWNAVINNGDASALFDKVLFEEGQNTDFGQILLAYIKENVKETIECHTAIVTLGIISLKLFLQENWTGPPVDVTDWGTLAKIVASKDLNDRALILLESSGEELYQLLSYPVLLLIAHVILVEARPLLRLFVTLPIWSVKCIAAYVYALEETRENNFENFKDVIETVECDDSKFKALPKDVQAEFYLDSSHLYLKFYDYQKAKNCHDKVKSLLQIEISLTASLGKRTKFQQKELPQMKLNVIVDQGRDYVQTRGEVTEDLPTDVTLDDDTLLPNIKFIDAEAIKNIELSPIDQAYAVSSCLYLQKTRPRDKLTHEEVLPFVDSVLMSPQSWSIQYKSLFLRCVTEFSNSRKAERALNQLESLTKSVSKVLPKASERLRHMQSVDLQPKWSCQRVYAQLLFSIGCTDSALEIFLRLHLWDDVIACYQRLGKHGKAEAVIWEQLAVRESATLWCLLGDATLDKQYYEQAWEFSKHRNARSQRSLGLWHLRRQEFAEAVPYFEKSLELNYLQPGIAFSLGCACMSTQQLETAAKSFQHCISLDPDNHEAWNNLASNFIRLGKLPKAYKALQESSRLSYDNWKIWENFLLVCTDIGAFEDSINCCHRLVDLRQKDIDSEVLQILVDAVLNDEEDHRGIPASRLKTKILKMFGHITSQITHNPIIWELYAKLYLSNHESNDRDKGLQYLYKSHRCYTQNTEWEKSETRIPDVMRVTNKMMEVTKDVCSRVEFQSRSISLYSTTKMAVTNLILRLGKAYCDDMSKPLVSVQSFISELESHVTELQALIGST